MTGPQRPEPREPGTEAGRRLLTRYLSAVRKRPDLDGLLTVHDIRRIEEDTMETGERDWKRAVAIAAEGDPGKRAEHKPGDHHRYRIECEVCGQPGTIRLTVDPEREADAAAAEKIGGAG